MSTTAKGPLPVRDVYADRIYLLESELWRGGEGYIYAVQGEPSVVAKVYRHRNQEAHQDFEKRRLETAHKIEVMLANPPRNPTAAEGHPSYAWPTGLISKPSDSTVIGFLMPRIVGMKEVFEFYNPGRRRTICPSFNYLYLHQTARNLAGIMHEVHSKGYVVGDVNQKNILVSDRALVTLIDTDSFQVRDPRTGRLYLCPVGSIDFMAPELGKKKNWNVERTAEQDLFGLAVLIFHLLMEGVHPFSGIELGSDEPRTPQQRVLSGEFTYAPDSKLQPMAAAIPFETLHPDLRALFVRCFVGGQRDPHSRPNAREWRIALDKAAKDLHICKKNKKHFYGVHLGAACPWCARVARGLNDPFPLKATISSKATSPTRQPRTPGTPPATPTPPVITTPPTTQIPWGKVFLYGVIIILFVLRLWNCVHKP